MSKNPYTQTGRTGPFGYAPDGHHHEPVFGQIEMADAIVTCTFEGVRHILLVERSDGHGWALPGGHIDPGDTSAFEAALRELWEETTLVLSQGGGRLTLGHDHEVIWTDLTKRHVPDPRETDDAWAVTTPVLFSLGETKVLPEVAGADDATQAVWVAALSYSYLCDHLAELGRVFPAHEALLKEVLG